MSGLLGYGACHEATHEADLLVLLGTDFPYDNFLPDGPAAQVDHDPTKLGRRIPIDVGVTGDVGETIRAVLPLVRAEDRSRRSSTGCCAATPRSWRASSPPTRATSSARCRSIRSTSPPCSTSSRTTTRSSPSTPGCATSGRRAT